MGAGGLHVDVLEWCAKKLELWQTGLVCYYANLQLIL